MLKVDTKEKFSVMRFTDGVFTVNVAEALTTNVMQLLQSPIKNMIIDMENVVAAETPSLAQLATLHEAAYTNNASFVICNVKDSIKMLLDNLELTDILNITPTESEAWDIVQMEEIERELFGNED